MKRAMNLKCNTAATLRCDLFGRCVRAVNAASDDAIGCVTKERELAQEREAVFAEGAPTQPTHEALEVPPRPCRGAASGRTHDRRTESPRLDLDPSGTRASRIG